MEDRDVGKYKYYAVVFFWIWVMMALVGGLGVLGEKISKWREERKKMTENDDE